jgi:hypothetical protein
LTNADDTPPSAQEHVEKPTEGALAREMTALVRSGRAAQLLTSHALASRLQFQVYGGAGLMHACASFLPRLQQAGVSESDSALLRHANGAQLLSWWRPPPPAARQVKQWACNACHRTFDEACNPAEALPDDRHYYEKFDGRYCSMHCLSAHRKAGFPPTFSCAPPAE